MCGIVGYIGKNQAAPILLEGLSKLEYRGYDSAGIAVYNNNELRFFQKKLTAEKNLAVIWVSVIHVGQLTASRQT